MKYLSDNKVAIYTLQYNNTLIFNYLSTYLYKSLEYYFQRI